ncbi:sterol desaturase/sphingolipid hydroxylase (fatty acid hydroxylase superfamily) [Nitrospirillum amazonense]|uniref:Sterol desaturase/sphingolipid hydroxylase (Fatty acid hydroxylase superfamily) n=1 Tax=Nitrospirillum amazonense TaxID=28077 RepID=A0A560KHN4_9PROT|nr:sterol desaturase family protein [Nitrospirillum amazonense]TWB82712.1 sterol desaturase/sphingolipid hydroxylase (fatty acid hydroxylase superfamily) [Nitrospirillum amazonense]
MAILGGASVLPLKFYPVVAAAVAAEVAWYAARRRPYPWSETATSVAVLLMRIPMKLALAGVVAPVAWYAWTHRIATVPLDRWWGLALLFAGEEFCYYWGHRLGHEVRWVWASHSVHHSPTALHLASAFRLGVTEVLSGGWLVYVPLYFLGFNPVAVAGMLALNLFYQFWLHTEAVGTVGPLEWVLNTPAHHRVHHASNLEYLDRNYGGVVIVWDRLFGTFAQASPDVPLTYGLAHVAPSGNPLVVCLREWRAMARDVARARGVGARLRQLFGRPGDSLSARVTSLRQDIP